MPALTPPTTPVSTSPSPTLLYPDDFDCTTPARPRKRTREGKRIDVLENKENLSPVEERELALLNLGGRTAKFAQKIAVMESTADDTLDLAYLYICLCLSKVSEKFIPNIIHTAKKTTFFISNCKNSARNINDLIEDHEIKKLSEETRVSALLIKRIHAQLINTVKEQLVMPAVKKQIQTFAKAHHLTPETQNVLITHSHYTHYIERTVVLLTMHILKDFLDNEREITFSSLQAVISEIKTKLNRGELTVNAVRENTARTQAAFFASAPAEAEENNQKPRILSFSFDDE